MTVIWTTDGFGVARGLPVHLYQAQFILYDVHTRLPVANVNPS